MEKTFVESVMATIVETYPGADVQRSNDNFTLGIPDILAWVPTRGIISPVFWGSWKWDRAWSLAIECKEISPLMDDPFHRGRRIGQMLKHPFTGPQVSRLRVMEGAGVEAFGLVRASRDTAFRIAPKDLPAKTGNFTHEELVAIGKPIRRSKGMWRFWNIE